MHRLHFAFYNLGSPNDPNRDPAQISRELNALANNTAPQRKRDPVVIGLCEAIGFQLPAIDNYRLVRDVTSDPRKNIAAYVRADLDVEFSWEDLEKTWPRTQGPGPHPPRSNLLLSTEDWTVMVGHAPPAVHLSAPSRAEWRDAAVAFLRGSEPRLLLSDSNWMRKELVALVGDGARSFGTPIESAHGRGVALRGGTHPKVNGVAMLSDHKKALLGRATALTGGLEGDDAGVAFPVLDLDGVMNLGDLKGGAVQDHPEYDAFLDDPDDDATELAGAPDKEG